MSYLYVPSALWGREAPLHFCLPGITSGGLRKWASETGGGYSLSAKQEVAQHLFLGTQRGSRQPAVCVSECVLIQAEPASRQALWHSTPPPPKKNKKISEWLSSITETFHFLWLDFLTCGWGGSNLGFIVAVGQKWHCDTVKWVKVLNSDNIIRQIATNWLLDCDRFYKRWPTWPKIHLGKILMDKPFTSLLCLGTCCAYHRKGQCH